MRSLPDGSKAWFVKIRTATKLKLNPISWEGWAVTLLFAVAMTLLWTRIATLRPRGLHVFATLGAAGLTIAAIVLLIAVANRKSISITPTTGDETMTQGRMLRAHFRVRPGYWFVPKLFGFGATPVTWQGWTLTIGFAALLMLDLRFMPEVIAKVGVAVALTTLFLAICVRKTQGGWHWRWGPGK